MRSDPDGLFQISSGRWKSSFLRKACLPERQSEKSTDSRRECAIAIALRARLRARRATRRPRGFERFAMSSGRSTAIRVMFDLTPDSAREVRDTKGRRSAQRLYQLSAICQPTVEMVAGRATVNTRPPYPRCLTWWPHERPQHGKSIATLIDGSRSPARPIRPKKPPRKRTLLRAVCALDAVVFHAPTANAFTWRTGRADVARRREPPDCQP
jgi:hypothetical protein